MEVVLAVLFYIHRFELLSCHMLLILWLIKLFFVVFPIRTFFPFYKTLLLLPCNVFAFCYIIIVLSPVVAAVDTGFNCLESASMHKRVDFRK